MKTSHRTALLLSSLLSVSSVAGLASTTPDSPPKSIPVDQLGTTAQQQYSGDGLSIEPTAEGARLRADFQDLEGRATAEGLWLESMAEAGSADRLRVSAQSFGRADEPQTLPPQGVVKAGTDSALFLRPGLMEEYRVSMDGVRQDFIVLERPAGTGSLGLTLEVTGARAETADYGVKLTLQGSGRELGYSRLHVTDAQGRELPARMTTAGSHRISIQVDDATAIYPVRIDPTFSDADWITFGGARGTNGPVTALAVDGAGNLYIGGSNFQIVGSTVAANIAKWDGTTWTALGSGPGGNVYAIAIVGGYVYSGGSFLKRWDGSVWSTLGTGLADSSTVSVSSLLAVGADLYVGGHFQTAGGVTVNNIAKWNGTTWSALGSGIIGHSVTSKVEDMEVSNGYLYAGGIFTSAGGAASTGNLARWHLADQTWSGIGGGASAVNCIAVMGGDLYIGGSFPISGGGNESRVAKWNGTQWNTIGPVLTTGVSDMIIHNGQLYVCGGFIQSASVKYLARWDGTAWAPVGQGADYLVNCLASLNGDLIAGGDFQAIGGVAASRLARWDGTMWTALTGGQGASDTVNAIAVIGADVYVGGEFGSIGGIAARYLARWNGSQWQRLGSGLDDDFTADGGVRTLIVSGTDLYVGGDFGSAGGVTGTANIAQWDGSVWHALGNGLGNDVHAIAVHDGNVYAGGDFQDVGGTISDRIAKWDGTSWTPLGNGFSSTVRALASYQGELYAGGAFTQVSQGIVKWDGTAWSAVGQAQSGVGTSVSVMQVWNGQLYVAGSFTQIGGLSVSNLARWNGTAWSAVGSNLTGVGVVAFAPYGGHLLVSRITTVNGVAYDNIAAWNGGSWAPWGTKLAFDFGTASHGQVRALAVFGSRLMAGGQFINAGGRVSTYLAQLQLPDPDIVLEQPSGAHLISGVSAVGYGDGFPGIGKSKTFTLRNGGPVALTVSALSVTGGQEGEFAVNTAGMLMSVPAGGSTTFTVTMNAASLGAKATTLQITSNDPDEGTFQIALSGTAVLPPEIVVEQPLGTELADGATRDFGAVGIGMSNTLSFIIKNTGCADLTGLTITKTGPNAADFTVSANPATPLPPGGSTSFTVQFSPAMAGALSSTLNIASNDEDEGSFDIHLTGTGFSVPSWPGANEFGTGGVANVDPGGDYKMASLSTGGIILAKVIPLGPFSPPTGAEIVLARLKPDGSPDHDFLAGPGAYGLPGRIHTPIFGAVSAAAVVVQNDGKILVAGTVEVTGPPPGAAEAFMLVRFLADGSLDSSFDGDGVAIADISIENDHAADMILQPDGRILVLGLSDDPNPFVSRKVAAVVRFLPSGELDASWAFGGVQTSAFETILTGAVTPKAMVRQADGSVIITGHHVGAGSQQVFVARFGPNGETDPVFTHFPDLGTGNHWVSGLGVQANDKIVLLGGAGETEEAAECVVLRLEADGVRDTTFGGGTSLVELPPSMHGPSSILETDPNGRLLVVARHNSSSPLPIYPLSYYPLYFVRLSSDGALDPSFGDTGSGAPPGGLVVSPAEFGDLGGLLDTAKISKNGLLALARTGATTTPVGTSIVRLALDASSWPGTDDFNDNVRDPAKWAAADSVHGGAQLIEAGGRLEYRVSTPDGEYDEALRHWLATVPTNSEAFEAIVDVHNGVTGNNASIGLTVTSLQDARDSLYLELYRVGPDGSGFLAALKSNVHGGDEVPPTTLPSGHGVMDGTVRLVFEPATKIFTTYYDTTGSADGYQWQVYGSFGVGASGGGTTRNSPWLLGNNAGFRISISGFSEGLVIPAGQVFADNFSVTVPGRAREQLLSWADAAGLSGNDAEPEAAPFDDGVPNLLKYAFNMDGSGPNVAVISTGGEEGLPLISRQSSGVSGTFRFEFIRRVGSSLLYIPQKSEGLVGGTWQALLDQPNVIPINEQWERVIYEEPYDTGTTARCFGRVLVVLP